MALVIVALAWMVFTLTLDHATVAILNSMCVVSSHVCLLSPVLLQACMTPLAPMRLCATHWQPT